MANTKLCEQCNLNVVKRIGKKFCSKKCYWKSREGQPLSCPEDVRLEGSRAGVEAARQVVLGTKQSPEHLKRRLESMARTLAGTVRQCEHCGESFTPTHAVQIYCSGRCWNSVNRARRPRAPKFTIPIKEYRRLFEEQGGKCAICDRIQAVKLAVDHCHTRLVARGLLCHRCNSAIGLLRDDPKILESAIRYLQKHEPLKE